MAVLRIVADLRSDDPGGRAAFYQDLLGMETAMDMGWIVTLKGAGEQTPQISFASTGGSGAPTPDLSIEVDDLDDVLARARQMNAEIEYGPVTEPWGVRRFFVRDPAGALLNILTHQTED
ncbi:MAG: VOC family protein [Pseudomonadota bacterium]